LLHGANIISFLEDDISYGIVCRYGFVPPLFVN